MNWSQVCAATSGGSLASGLITSKCEGMRALKSHTYSRRMSSRSSSPSLSVTMNSTSIGCRPASSTKMHLAHGVMPAEACNDLIGRVSLSVVGALEPTLQHRQVMNLLLFQYVRNTGTTRSWRRLRLQLLRCSYSCSQFLIYFGHRTNTRKRHDDGATDISLCSGTRASSRCCGQDPQSSAENVENVVRPPQNSLR